MSESWNVRNLEDVLRTSLENGEKIVDKKVSALTAPGDNYGSIMLRIDLDLKNDDTGTERTLHAVAKLIPEGEKIQEVFNTQLTYRNEYKFYAEIVPAFDKLLKSKGISNGADFIAPFFGGRLNLDGTEAVTTDAVILMQNLKPEGYTVGQKRDGFDVEGSKIILNALAKFHASGIALKHLEPETFKEKVEPYIHFYLTDEKMYEMTLNKTIEELGKHGFTSEEIDVVIACKKENVIKPYINDTWGTIIHYDSWTNNFLIKYEGTKPIHAVIVDFQICGYKSPLDDVMFFLFTSVKPDIFEESLDPLLEYYYKQLLDYLKTLGVDIEPFTKSSFDDEVKFAVRDYEYAHTIWMMLPIMHEAFQSINDLANVKMDWSEKHLQKVLQLTRTCFKKGWLG